ncbi:EC7 protein [Colletotrichum asianum]|uniref:EC7 protein n=1 Tax=Colletotrichum asianum TaxID=702518 RepID=A0A8H3VVH8_9PEZI|nr:EC7 protein [Colletotrichum asianum]
MVAIRYLLALLPLAAAMPSQLESSPLIKRHCDQPKNCGALVQGTACDFCCAANVKPDGMHCKSRNTGCANGGTTFNCDAD